MHEGNEAGAGDGSSRTSGLHIVSDPALIMIAATVEAPGLEIQSSTFKPVRPTMKPWLERTWPNPRGFGPWSFTGGIGRDSQTYRCWDWGLVRGAMCISYSGRCTLSNHMSMRDANRGGCSQSCRWKYDLPTCLLVKNVRVLKVKFQKNFQCQPLTCPWLTIFQIWLENGVDSLKIEGRMKSIHYVSTVTNCFR